MKILKISFFIISLMLFLATGLLAQKSKPITVAAGLKVEDCIPFQERYRYPVFTSGKVYFQSTAYSASTLNLNFLSREIEFLHSGDTLSIANPEDIKLITIGTDTFYYDNGYMELLSGNQLKVAVKQYFKINEIQKKDSYGNSGSLGATDAYSTYQSGGLTYKLVLNRDMVFEKISEYYLAVSKERFVPFNKKQILKLFPLKKDAIQDFLKSNKVDFASKEDLIRFAEYLGNL